VLVDDAIQRINPDAYGAPPEANGVKLAGGDVAADGLTETARISAASRKRDQPPDGRRELGPSSVSGTYLHVESHFCRPTRHPKTLRNSPRRSAMTRTNQYWNLLDRHLSM
jgi:hypothetical protein